MDIKRGEYLGAPSRVPMIDVLTRNSTPVSVLLTLNIDFVTLNLKEMAI